MKTNPNKLWIIILALGWLFDFLFWKKTPAVNFSIFSMACLVAAFYLLLSDGLRPHRASLGLLPLFGFFAAVTFIRAEPVTALLAGAFTLLAMAILAVTYRGGHWIHYTITDYLSKTIALVGSMLVRPVSFMVAVRTARAGTVTGGQKNNLWPILRGLLIALPVVAIFASLLASADAVFGQRLANFVELFKLEKFPEYTFRFIYILVIGYALAGVVLHAASESLDEKLAGGGKPVIPIFLGFIESSIVLGSVVTLFVSFVGIQFQYFFGGHANINVEGFTYSEYARRGFGELVAVAFFALLMLLTLSAVTKRETDTQRKIYSGLGVALVALLLVMLVSAYQRLGLYEAAYGFSRLRTYTHVFLIWIGLLLVATIVLEILHKESMFAFAMLIASFGFAVSLPILNVDAFIVNQNIQREVQGVTDDGVDLDAQYFIGLSADAIPALAKALQTPTLPGPVQEKVGAALACIRYQRGQDMRVLPWQSFHYARFNADRALASVKNELDRFEVIDKEQPVWVTTPSGEEFSCSPYYD